MKSRLLWGFGLVLLFLLLLLITAPATVLTRTASSMVPGLGFSGVSGSLWQGNVTLLRYDAIALQNLRWQLSPWQLLLGRAAVQIEFNDGLDQRGQGALIISAGGAIEARDVSLQTSAQALQPLVRLTGVSLGGNLQLDLATLSLHSNRFEQMQGRLVWQQAVIRTPLGEPRLGSYAVDLGSDGEGGVNANLTDIEGVLGLTGQLHLNTRGYTLDASVRRDLPEELDRFFRVIAQPVGDRYQLRWEKPFAQ